MNVEAWCLLLLFHISHLIVAVSAACPRVCFCNSESKIIYCSRKNLKHIPRGIPKNTKALNLNENNFQISTLRRRNFTAYLNLEQIFLSECGISAIEVGTFIDLGNLRWLDLSKNRIKDLQDFTFRGLSLLHLFLNGNKGIVIHDDSFNLLRTEGLYLERCGLTEITSRQLKPLNGSLNNLWLDYNQIKRFRPNILDIFSYLEHVRVNDNPFHCNCRLTWFKEFYDKNRKLFGSASTNPRCATPIRIKNKHFDKLSLGDFRCEPPIFNDVDILFSNNNGIVSCSAMADPPPTIQWTKPDGRVKIFPPPVSEGSFKTDAIMRISHEDDGVHSGSYVCLASNSAGNVTLKINVSWPKIEHTTVVRYIEAIAETPDGEEEFGRVTKQLINPALTTSPSPLPTTPLSKVITDISTMYGPTYVISTDRTFSMLELVGAILGTFSLTVIMCLITFYLCLKIRRDRSAADHLPPNVGGLYALPPNCGQPAAKENLYLDTKVDDDDLYMGINDVQT
ncbi:leucine-rich repeat-containing protein 4C-like [Tubulanus polymorphus]|uniref:leucine-rich repeat-containing protein 4C-like n=1 Tax=Tubulanus polymorphus TaxID=672921 RepID=UPI003DA31A0B